MRRRYSKSTLKLTTDFKMSKRKGEVKPLELHAEWQRFFSKFHLKLCSCLQCVSTHVCHDFSSMSYWLPQNPSISPGDRHVLICQKDSKKTEEALGPGVDAGTSRDSYRRHQINICKCLPDLPPPNRPTLSISIIYASLAPSRSKR